MSPLRVAFLFVFLALIILVAWNAWVFVATQELLPLQWNLIILSAHGIIYGLYYSWDKFSPQKVQEMMPKLIGSFIIAVVCGVVITAIIGVIIGHSQFDRTLYSVLAILTIPLTWYFYRKFESQGDESGSFQTYESKFGMSLEKAINVIGDYGIVVEEFYSGQLENNEFKMKLPESKLPYSKDDIKRACVMLYTLLKNQKIREGLAKLNNDFTKHILTKEFNEHLRTGYYLLSECLPDKEAHLCNRYFQSALNPDMKMTDSEIDKVQKILNKTREEGQKLLYEMKKLEVQA